jgi:hypothetical protein
VPSVVRIIETKDGFVFAALRLAGTGRTPTP